MVGGDPMRGVEDNSDLVGFALLLNGAESSQREGVAALRQSLAQGRSHHETHLLLFFKLEEDQAGVETGGRVIGPPLRLR